MPYNAGAEILNGLLQLVAQGGIGLANAAESGKKAVKEKSPMALISQLVGQASNIPDMQNLNNALAGTQTMKQNPGFNPYQDMVQKSVKKGVDLQVSQAMDSGVPAEHILSQAGILNQFDSMMVANNSSQAGFQQSTTQQPLLQSLLAMAQQPQQPQQPANHQMTPIQQQVEQLTQPKGFFGRWQENFNKQVGNVTDADRLANLSKAQELMGQQPLQQGRREELSINFANEIRKQLEKTNNPDALTPEVASKFNLLIEGNDAVNEAASFLKEENGIKWSLPSFMKSQRSRQYELAVKRMIDNKNRLETGASMNKDELDKAYQKYKPGKTDDPETMRRRLQPLSKFYQGSLNTADPTGVHRKRASGESNNETTIGRFQVRYH